MARASVKFACTECGQSTARWLGKCPGCGSFGTLVEEAPPPRATGTGSVGTAQTPLRLDQVEVGAATRIPTGLSELDRVLGGGLVPGSVSLLGGEPGIGKSTLLLQMASAMAVAGHRVLYVSAEDSRQQVRLRAERLGTLAAQLWLVS